MQIQEKKRGRKKKESRERERVGEVEGREESTDCDVKFSTNANDNERVQQKKAEYCIRKCHRVRLEVGLLSELMANKWNSVTGRGRKKVCVVCA